MKNLIIALMITFELSAAAQDSALAWHTDVKMAADLSIKEKKPLFLFFTGSDWCGVCKRLQNEVFSQPQFQTWVKENVIPVELDFPRTKQLSPQMQEQNNLLKEMFGITGYPTVVFVTPVKKQNQLFYTRLGNVGYLTGGADVWLNAANQFIPARQ